MRTWQLTDEKINQLQVNSIDELIRRCKAAHYVNVQVRINGKFEEYQADWLKHLKAISGATVNDRDFLRELIARGQSASEGYFQFAHIVACLLDKSLHEQLTQLINGPTWDGHVVSKSQRDELIRLGLATRVCCKGEQGHTGATYFAFSVMKLVKEMLTGEIAA